MEKALLNYNKEKENTNELAQPKVKYSNRSAKSQAYITLVEALNKLKYLGQDSLENREKIIAIFKELGSEKDEQKVERNELLIKLEEDSKNDCCRKLYNELKLKQFSSKCEKIIFYLKLLKNNELLKNDVRAIKDLEWIIRCLQHENIYKPDENENEEGTSTKEEYSEMFGLVPSIETNQKKMKDLEVVSQSIDRHKTKTFVSLKQKRATMSAFKNNMSKLSLKQELLKHVKNNSLFCINEIEESNKNSTEGVKSKDLLLGIRKSTQSALNFHKNPLQIKDSVTSHFEIKENESEMSDEKEEEEENIHSKNMLKTTNLVRRAPKQKDSLFNFNSGDEESSDYEDTKKKKREVKFRKPTIESSASKNSKTSGLMNDKTPTLTLDLGSTPLGNPGLKESIFKEMKNRDSKEIIEKDDYCSEKSKKNIGNISFRSMKSEDGPKEKKKSQKSVTFVDSNNKKEKEDLEEKEDKEDKVERESNNSDSSKDKNIVEIVPNPNELTDEVKELLEIIDEPDFDIFSLDRLLNKQTLYFMTYEVFNEKGYFNTLLKKETFKNFIDEVVANGYSRLIPYHNDLHAADVFQTVFVMFSQGDFEEVR